VEADLDFDALAERFRRKGFAVALHMLGNADDAADAVQEGLSALWTRRQEIRPGSDPTAWFFKVLRNRCVDQLRRGRVRRAETTDGTELPDRRAARPDAAAERNEFRVRLRQELAQLDLPHREIVILRDLEGLSYAQIAEVLGVAPGTVMSRLHRARMMLRERLQDLL